MKSGGAAARQRSHDLDGRLARHRDEGGVGRLQPGHQPLAAGHVHRHAGAKACERIGQKVGAEFGGRA